MGVYLIRDANVKRSRDFVQALARDWVIKPGLPLVNNYTNTKETEPTTCS